MSERRKFYKNSLHHIYNRGSKKELLYYDNYDYERFLKKTFHYSTLTGDSILQFCLLPNHFHLLVKAHNSQSISNLMLRIQTSHARYFCNKYSTVGRIFQGKFKSVLIDSDKHLMTISRYIHRNPAEYFESELSIYEYPWSSMTEYLAKEDGMIPLKDKNIILNLFNSADSYREFVSAEEVIFHRRMKSKTYIF